MTLFLIELFLEIGIIISSIFIGINLLITGSILKGFSAKLIGIGIIFLALDSVDKVLEHLNLDLFMTLLPPMGEELFHDLLKFSGMLFISIGLFRLSSRLVQKN